MVLPDAVFNYTPLDECPELREENFPYSNGCKFSTVLVNCQTYLRSMMKRFRENEGEISYETIYSFQELYGKYDIIVNCSGMRGRELVADAQLRPVKAHVVRV